MSAGTVALLMQKYPDMGHDDIRALLLTTVKPVSDAFGNSLSINDSGAGRLDIANTFDARLVIQPTSLIVNLSSLEPTEHSGLELKLLEGTLGEMAVSFEGPEFIGFEETIKGNYIGLKWSAGGDDYGDHEGRIHITHADINYVIPVLLHYTEGRIDAQLVDDRLVFDIEHPEEWGFARIEITNSRNGITQTLTVTPDTPASIPIHENAKYWVEGDILTHGGTSDAFTTIMVHDIPEQTRHILDSIQIPDRQIGIVSGIALVIGIVGLYIQKRTS